MVAAKKNSPKQKRIKPSLKVKKITADTHGINAGISAGVTNEQCC